MYPDLIKSRNYSIDYTIIIKHNTFHLPKITKIMRNNNNVMNNGYRLGCDFKN